MRDPVPDGPPGTPQDGAAATSAAEAHLLQPQELESEAWRAVAMREGAEFFRDHMADDALMVLPDALLRKEDVIAAVNVDEPWEEFHFTDERLLKLRNEVHLLTYRVRAKRAARPWYEALSTSLYVNDSGRWQLSFHQQTPQQPVSDDV